MGGWSSLSVLQPPVSDVTGLGCFINLVTHRRPGTSCSLPFKTLTGFFVFLRLGCSELDSAHASGDLVSKFPVLNIQIGLLAVFFKYEAEGIHGCRWD